MKQLTALLAFSLVIPLCGYAQQATLKGTVIDTSEKRNLAHAVVALLRPADSVMVSFTRTDANGKFSLQKLSPGTYLFMVTRPAYADYFDKVTVNAGPTDLGQVAMILKSQLLQEVVVQHKLGAIRIKGDTTEYVADSFKLGPGATVEDLLKKLPGIQVDKDGKITAQGETVQKVLVDGEEFFSDDPTIATRGLTSDAVDKVQVYDKKSDQAAFTGIDDGQRTKTIDLKLKEDKKNGHFGKVELGTNAVNRWNNNVMLNAFKGKRKLAAFGIMSNTGKVGLDFNERMNYGNSGGIEMGFEDGGAWISVSDNDEFGGNHYGQGLPKGWAGGVHYSNKWNADKMHLNSGYQFNKLNIAARGVTFNQYLLPDTILYVNEEGNNKSSKDRHKITAMYEFQVDSLSSVKVTAEGSKGTSYNEDYFNSESLNNFGDMLSTVKRKITSSANSDRFNATLLWKQKFKKQGRTLSLSANQRYTNNQSTGILESDNSFFNNGDTTFTYIDQQKLRDNITNAINARVVYTEPLSKRALLEFSYGIDNNNRKSRITTLEKDDPNGKYQTIVDTLSNDYRFDVLTHTAGIGYRYAKPKRMTIGFGINVAKAVFNREDLQTKATARYNFTNFYPQANMSFDFGSRGNLRFNYNGNTRPPSIDQIQPVLDNTDQLNIRIGNPDLKQSFRHNLRLSYNSFKFLSERSIFTNFNFNTTQNDFSTISRIDKSTGRKVYQPVNVNGNFYLSNWSHFGMKIKKLWGIRAGMNISANMSRNINFIDDMRNQNDNYTIGGGPSISYRKEKKFEFWAETHFTRVISKSSLRPDVVTRYWLQEHNIHGTVYLPWRLEIGTSCEFNLREKTSAFERNNNAIRWNMHVDRKLFKNDAAKIRFTANDILDQNIDFNRNVNSNFISERTYDTLRRYFLLSFIWNFSKNGKPMQW